MHLPHLMQRDMNLCSSCPPGGRKVVLFAADADATLLIEPRAIRPPKHAAEDRKSRRESPVGCAILLIVSLVLNGFMSISDLG